MTGRTPVAASDVRTAVDILHHADQDWEYLSDEERHGAVREALNLLIETGEKILWSETTETYYVVTRWIPQGDGKFTALSKRKASAEEAERLDTGSTQHSETGK